jgi:hypothetical protein
MTQVKDIIDRIKNLQEFSVTTDLPETFEFRGAVPYDTVITGDKITLKIHAVTLEEATDKAMKYLGERS